MDGDEGWVKMANDDIRPIPYVPQEIREAVNDNRLVVFIGAGISRLIGCDGWDALARNLVKRCYEEKLIKFQEYEALNKYTDHKKTITICHRLFEEKEWLDMFFDEMNKALKENDEDIKIPNIYDDIVKLRGVCVTTNADTHLDRLFNPEKIIFESEKFNKNISRDNLYHIHGSIKERSSLIFRLEDYFKRYSQDSEFTEFMKSIFGNNVVLFLGYGLAEFEILDYLFSKMSLPSGNRFLLHPFFSYEANMLGYEKDYYKLMKIELIPYLKDENGYEQLIDVIRAWQKEITEITRYLPQTITYLDKIIDRKANPDEISKTLSFIKTDKSVEDYFFAKLSSSPYPFEWLTPLIDHEYFNPKNNPKSKKSPDGKYYLLDHWNILGVLENIAIKNEQNPVDEVTEQVATVIKNVITYRKDGERIQNPRIDWMILSIITHLPICYINQIHFDFLNEALKSRVGSNLLDSEIGKKLLPKFIKEKAKDLLLKTLDVVLDGVQAANRLSKEIESVISDYYLKEALDENKKGISQLCPVEAGNIAIAKIQKIVNEDKSQFNYVWIPTIEDHEQTTFTDRYECQLVHFLRDMFEAANPKKIEAAVKDMIDSEHDIFQRLAYHLINFHYETLSYLFWNINYNPIDNVATHEVFELFKAHCKEFQQEEIDKIILWSDARNFYHEDKELTEEEISRQEKIEAYYKKEWLFSILESKNKKVEELYDKFNLINDAPLDHPGFHCWSSGAHIVEDESIIEDGALDAMTIEQIVDFINSHVEESPFSRRGHFRRSLSFTIKKYVAKKPERFLVNLDAFLNVPKKYQNDLLEGFEDAWKSDKTFSFSEILLFSSELISEENFWDQDNEDYEHNKNIASTIADIIEAGTRDDKHAFPQEDLPIIDKVVIDLMQHAVGDMHEMTNLVNSALNSLKGRIFIAAIQYSLRYARVYSVDSDDRFVESVMNEFTVQLDKKLYPSVELSIVLGWYIAFLHYLNKNWVSSNINKIFDVDSHEHWQAAFIGHITMSSTVYEGVYKLLKENNHYQRAIKESFDDKTATAKLVQNIVIGYIANWDELFDSNGLISMLIEQHNAEKLNEIVTFLWRFRDKEDQSFQPKVKPLWSRLIAVIESDPVIYKEISVDLAKWLSLVDIIDEDIFNWLKFTANAITSEWDAGYFVEYLSNHVGKTPQYVADLFLLMLDNEVFSSYKSDCVIAIVNELYRVNLKTEADRICNKHLNNGFHFLKEIYEKHNK